MKHSRDAILVAGSANLDFVVRADHVPAPGETVLGRELAIVPGGKGANQAVAAARLGASVSFVGAVGDDEFGSSSGNALSAEGVDVDGLATLTDAATGTALIVVDRQGENQIAVASGANTAFGREIWDGVPLPDALFLACFEVGDDAIVAGAQRAVSKDAPIVINPAPARDLPLALLATRPILVPNEGEAAALTGHSDSVAAAKSLAGRSNAPVIVTLGPKGALVVDGERVQSVAAPKVEAVDTTGAGDTFVGALAADLSVGRPLLEAVRFAVHAASLSVRVAGAREGMPSREEVEQSLST